MGEKDIFERMLTNNTEIVADLLNLLLFDGRDVVQPSELQPLSSGQEYWSDDQLRELRRDSFILWSKGGDSVCVLRTRESKRDR